MSGPIERRSADDGGHVSAAIVDQASAWLVKIWSGVATTEDYEACARWRAAHADHERAWQRLQALEQKLDAVPRGIAHETLKRSAISTNRRRALKGLAVLLSGGAATHVAGRTTAWQHLVADHRTRIGEIRTLVLADSTRITLNTASAIDVTFDAQRRRVELRSGEIMISTASDPRPFVVATAHGTVRALGTRFSVRHTGDDISRVAVFEGAVLIRPDHGNGAPLRLDAGQHSTFSGTTTHDVGINDESTSAWTHGSLVVERMRLDAFVEELSRYRPGVLRCDPAAGHYLLTGVYPLRDTDRILASIENALPIQVIYRHRYWVTVTTREPPTE